MSLRLLPDVNVWVALNFDQHSHHEAAKRWYQAAPTESMLAFCRQTQLGLFRILTTAAVMEQRVLTQKGCWEIYDRWVATGQVGWVDESDLLETRLRQLTGGDSASPKAWMDGYLAAFAESAGLSLVTFDRALAAKVKKAVLLG
jgi:uncharacterized protein